LSTSPRDRVRRATAVAMASAVIVVTGCVHQSKPGLQVKALQSDIVFGFTPKPAFVVPPTADTTPQIDLGAGPLELTLPPVARRRRLIFLPPLPVPTVVCPTAAESAFPAEQATFYAPAPPETGRYKWKETVTSPLGNGKSISTVTFVNHDIVNVSKVVTTPNPTPPGAAALLGTSALPITTFTYDEVIHNLDGTTTTTSYQVKNHALNITAGNPNGFLPNGSAPVGQPDAGLSIMKVTHLSNDGKTAVVFAPVTPVLLLPIDVGFPEHFVSTGAAADGSSLTVDAAVVHRSRVDACGTVIDGWEVDSTQVYTSPSGTPVTPVTDTYYVGTQIGSLLTYEHKAVPAALASATMPDIVDSIGQLHPSPIPAAAPTK
jgi:hypothetical protein